MTAKNVNKIVVNAMQIEITAQSKVENEIAPSSNEIIADKKHEIKKTVIQLRIKITQSFDLILFQKPKIKKGKVNSEKKITAAKL